MKQFFWILIIAMSLTACGHKGISQAEFDSMVMEKDKANASLIADLEAALAEKEALNQEVASLTKALSEADEVKAEVQDELAMAEAELELLFTGPTPGASLMMEASNIMNLLKLQDFAGVSAYIDPGLGLRLSPYQYVNTTSDVVLTPSDVSGLSTYPITLWGTQDGSGDPINLTGMDYYLAYVYDEDFEDAPFIGQNTVLSSGNMINNIAVAYPGDAFVEYYYDGFNPAYSGMDWRSLTLVMRQIGGQWYLVGLVHGQWTI